ncbi:hypothetical protein BHE74_00051947 [Ensete ventricosum]|nr:hypothetical protein GW17_00053951 [Ensete ventricosum]RWW42509.1 hypothetical protein BHE74_00051947 [Ensete ventricosum]
MNAWAPMPNHYWRLFNGSGFSLPMVNLGQTVVTAEGFLCLTRQVRTLAGMMQNVVPYILQLMQSLAPQQLIPQPTLQSESHPRNVIRTPPKLDTLLLGFDYVRKQLRQVNQRLDEVQKEFLKSKEELDESYKGGSPFVSEIQDRSILANFRLPSLESYDNSSDPSKYIAAFRTQMALYDTADAFMCRVFQTTLKRPTRMWYTVDSNQHPSPRSTHSRRSSNSTSRQAPDQGPRSSRSST